MRNPNRTKPEGGQTTHREMARDDEATPREESSQVNRGAQSANRWRVERLQGWIEPRRLSQTRDSALRPLLPLGEGRPPKSNQSLNRRKILARDRRLEIPVTAQRRATAPTRGNTRSVVREGGGSAQPLRRRLARLEYATRRSPESAATGSQSAQPAERERSRMQPAISRRRGVGSGSRDSAKAWRNVRDSQPAMAPSPRPRHQDGQRD